MVGPSSRNVATEAAEAGHETSDVGIRGVVIFTLGLVALAVLTQLGMYGLMRLYKKTEAVESAASPLGPPEQTGEAPSPRVTPQQSRIYLEMSREKQRILTSYGELPGEDGTIRIPIERAMQILGERSLSRTRPGSTNTPTTNTPTTNNPTTNNPTTNNPAQGGTEQ